MIEFEPTHPLSPEFTAGVDGILNDFLDEQTTLLTQWTPLLAEVCSAARTACRGGKHLRSAIAWWAGVAAGHPVVPPERVLIAVASLELFQAGTLVHDDIIDDSPLRRGKPSAQHRFATWHTTQRGTGPAAPFGRSAALLLGEVLLGWSQQLLHRAALPPEPAQRCDELLDAMRTEVMCGQLLDLFAAAELGDADLTWQVLDLKTARYTITRPAQFGAVLGGGSAELLSGLAEFGTSCGRAFQLRDDVLGVFGDPQITGKPSGDDLREGKRTLLISTSLDRANPTDTSTLQAVLGNPAAGESDLAAARAAIVRSGGLDVVEAQITEAADAAGQVLKRLPLTPEGSVALQALVRASVDRTS